MANIWPVRDGSEPTIGGPWAQIPADSAIELFKIDKEDFISDLSVTPRFGVKDRDLWFHGYRHIVVEIPAREARRIGWRPGFYLSAVNPTDAFALLIQQAISEELGAENVLRILYEPTTDSHGRDALRITVVISPGAAAQLEKGAAALNALVSLKERLREMREGRTPIVEYSTEAELAQDGNTKSRAST